MYLLQEGAKKAPRVNLLGSGTILREIIAARELLENDWGIAANVWSCPSFNELARDGQAVERWNLLHPTERPRVPFVAQQLEKYAGPVIASTDYMKNYAEQIRAFLPKGRTYKVLGTDGFGRSDFRTKLREHFEVDRHYVVVAALKALAEEGSVPATQGGRGDRQVRDRRRQDQPALRLKDRAMATVEVKVPDIGDFKDVEIIEVLVKPGDRIKAEQSLVTVESDKASMEIPSSAAGVVKEMRVKLGDKVSEGSPLLVLEGEGGGESRAAPAPAPPAAAHRCRRRAAPRRRPRRLRPLPPRRRAAPAASRCGPIEVVVPDIGDFDEVAVIEVLVKPGDTVAAEQSLITVESDKASMEIPSSHAGVVKALKVKVGDKVSKGSR